MHKKFSRIISLFLCYLLLVLTLSGCIEEKQNQIEQKELPKTESILDETSILPDWRDGGYHDYYGTTKLLNEFNDKYQNLIDIFSIGKSVLGKYIWCIRGIKDFPI